MPWWAAVVIGFGVAAVAAVVDMQRVDTLGQIYQVSYLVGCVAAVCLVRRHSLFGPMVQPPLVFAVTAISAYVFLGPPTNGGLRQLIFSVAIPLTSNFLTMATATGVTVVIGLFRLWRERDPNPPVRPNRSSRESRDDGYPAEAGGRGPRERPRRDGAAAPRPPRSRGPDAESAEPAPPRRAPRPARGEPRPDRGTRERGTPRGEPGPERGSRGRSRQPESPRPRDRETPERRPRDDPPPRRENPRGSQPRPRRRPEDPYR